MLTINLFSIPPALAGLFIAYIGIQIVIKNPRSQVHRALFYFCLSLCVWLFCYTVMYCCKDPDIALIWARCGFVGIAFIAFTNFYFNIQLLKITDKRALLVTLLSVSVLFALLGHTPLIYRDIGHFFWGNYPLAGPLYAVFMVYYIGTWLHGLKLLYEKMLEKKKNNDFLSYNQIKYVFIAWLGGSLGIVDFLPKYQIPIYPFAYFIALYWVLTSAISITQYRSLADTYFVARRLLIGSVFSGIIVTFFAICFGFLKTIHISSPIIIAVLSSVIGFLFQPVYKRTKTLIDKYFFPEYHERKEGLARLGEQIILSRNSDEFNRTILDGIFSLFKIVKASFFLLNKKDDAFELISATGWGLNVKDDFTTKISSTHCIPQYLQENQYLLLDNIRGDFSSLIDQKTLARAMLELDANVCIPIIFDNQVQGFFALGDKESGLPYSKEDIKALKTLADHTAYALEKTDLSKRWKEEVNKKQEIAGVFKRYISPTVADEILKQVSHPQSWKGERRYVTILVCDLRGFTKLSETQPPEQVAEYLNQFFTEMTQVIEYQGGTVDKFMGDAILVVFGAPLAIEDPEYRSINCALEMQHALTMLNKQREEQGLFTLGMGIGISAGEVIAGNIGSDKRMDYTVIGDAVNFASRLQGIADAGEILASMNMLDKIKDRFVYKITFPIAIKGRSQAVEYIRIISAMPPAGEGEVDLESNLKLL